MHDSPAVDEVAEETLQFEEENHDHAPKIKDEMKMIEKLYKKAVKEEGEGTTKKAKLVSSQEDGTDYLVMMKRGFLNAKCNPPSR